jgi:methylenetetrahydrofolate reductase (NADPH)
MTAKTPSKLEKVLAAGHFAVTSECGPPRGSDASEIVEKAEMIKDHVDAINITDNQTSVCRTCSLAACIRLKTMGLEPVLQMVTRDRNRIALQSDILGAASWDIHNILCLSGDHQSFGDSSKGQNVHDLDSMQLLQTVRLMRDEGKFLGGDDIKRPPQMFAGAAANPFADPFEIRVARLAKKVAAGAEFIQTQCIYNLDKFEEWMKGVRDRGLHEKCYIMAGLTPMKSAGMARYMKNRVPGMDVPGRGRQTPGRHAQRKTGRRRHQDLYRVHSAPERGGRGPGVPHHGHRVGRKVPGIVEAAGLYPRPEV